MSAASKILFLPRENKIHNWLEKTQVKNLAKKTETQACQNASMQRAHEKEGALYFLFAMQINLPIPTNLLGLNVHGFQYFQIFWRVKFTRAN